MTSNSDITVWWAGLVYTYVLYVYLQNGEVGESLWKTGKEATGCFDVNIGKYKLNLDSVVYDDTEKRTEKKHRTEMNTGTLNKYFVQFLVPHF